MINFVSVMNVKKSNLEIITRRLNSYCIDGTSILLISEKSNVTKYVYVKRKPCMHATSCVIK